MIKMTTGENNFMLHGNMPIYSIIHYSLDGLDTSIIDFIESVLRKKSVFIERQDRYTIITSGMDGFDEIIGLHTNWEITIDSKSEEECIPIICAKKVQK